jgi:ABC-type oligopeptide transport system ATPase subunit
MPEILLEVQNLKKYFPIKKGLFSKTIGYVKAVDDVSFTIKKGETLGLVGESCGKTLSAGAC